MPIQYPARFFISLAPASRSSSFDLFAQPLLCPAPQHYLDHDQKLKKFVPIIHGSVVYPVLYDANRVVLSLPPIINSAHSAVRAGAGGSQGQMLHVTFSAVGAGLGVS